MEGRITMLGCRLLIDMATSEEVNSGLYVEPGQMSTIL